MKLCVKNITVEIKNVLLLNYVNILHMVDRRGPETET